jgi:hypothetical protein
VPFLRVVRDKRGYETTYLMHWYREGARQRSRILYMFRTPGGVRVGRDPFDLQVRREIEANYPDIAFEWDVVRENQQVVEPLEQQRRRRPRREEGEAPAPAAPVIAEAVTPPAAPPRPPIPSIIDGTTADEQIAFLASWYPIVRDRIQSRAFDPSRLETLLAMAERLNPADWTDADHIATGLQQAAESLERLSHLLSRRRRRSRRKGARPGDATAQAEDAAVGEETVDEVDAGDGAESGDDIDPLDPSET